MARRKRKVLAVRPAGPGHQVVMASAPGPTVYRTQACSECPWRRDSPVGAFPAEAFRISAETAYDMADKAFACHLGGAGTVCAGFLNSGAAHNLSIRKAIANEKFSYADFPESEVPLYDSYREMAEANGVDPEDPFLKPCRP